MLYGTKHSYKECSRMFTNQLIRLNRYFGASRRVVKNNTKHTFNDADSKTVDAFLRRQRLEFKNMMQGFLIKKNDREHRQPQITDDIALQGHFEGEKADLTIKISYSYSTHTRGNLEPVAPSLSVFIELAWGGLVGFDWLQSLLKPPKSISGTSFFVDERSSFPSKLPS